jgi:hypothetical protein
MGAPGKPRPLWLVVLLSGASGLAYYGYYKWVIQDELCAHTGRDWSGALCILPFALGVAVPQILRLSGVGPEWVGWLSLLGIAWIYLVQFRLYCTVNALYRQLGLRPPLVVWWIALPGLNLVVGLRQIHFLSQYWARVRGSALKDPLAEALPFLSANS